MAVQTQGWLFGSGQGHRRADGGAQGRWDNWRLGT